MDFGTGETQFQILLLLVVHFATLNVLLKVFLLVKQKHWLSYWFTLNIKWNIHKTLCFPIRKNLITSACFFPSLSPVKELMKCFPMTYHQVAFLWFLKIITSEGVERQKRVKDFWRLPKTNFGVTGLGRTKGEEDCGFAVSPITPFTPASGLVLNQGKVIYKNSLLLMVLNKSFSYLWVMVFWTLRELRFILEDKGNVWASLYFVYQASILDVQNEGFGFLNLSIAFWLLKLCDRSNYKVCLILFYKLENGMCK